MLEFTLILFDTPLTLLFPLFHAAFLSRKRLTLRRLFSLPRY